MSAEDRNLIVREGRAEWTGTLVSRLVNVPVTLEAALLGGA